MAELTALPIQYLASQRLARLATAGADHKPHVVPTSFSYNAELGTVDVGGHHVATTKEVSGCAGNGWAAIVVDDLVLIDPWTARRREIRGRAEAIPTGGAHLGRGFGEAFIRIYPGKMNSFGIALLFSSGHGLVIARSHPRSAASVLTCMAAGGGALEVITVLGQQVRVRVCTHADRPGQCTRVTRERKCSVRTRRMAS